MISAGVEYIEAGRGEPIVFLHGIGGGAASFELQLTQLTNYRCIAWNMPGYGASVADTRPPSFEALSDSLATFITSLGLNRVHLVGQSIGGMLALEHAVRRQDQVATFTMIGATPSFGGRDESFKHAFLKARLAPLEAGKSMAQIAAHTAPLLVGPDATKQCIQSIETILAQVSEKTWRGILECLVTFNRRDDLANVMQPCCLIAGSDDQNSPARTIQKMAEKMTNAQFHLVDGAGHMVNQEAPALTNNILKKFLGQNAL